jgi:type II secretory pathway component PulF
MRLPAQLDVLSSARDRAQFYRSWASAHRAGLPHPAILDHVAGRTDGRTDEVRRYLLDGTTRGLSLLQLTDERPEIFETMERALIVLGEETGTLEDSFTWLAGHFEQRHRELTRAVSKSIYPLMVSLIAALILPLPMLARGEQRAWLLATLGGIVLWVAAAGSLFTALVAKAMRKPKLVRARLARGLAVAAGAGLPMDRIVALGVAAADHPEITAHVEKLSAARIRSQPLARTFAGCPHIPHEFLAAMKVAEDTGDFEMTLGRLAKLYEDGFA